jgi:hypothetical protein
VIASESIPQEDERFGTVRKTTVFNNLRLKRSETGEI